MIYTITFNPAIDYIAEVNKFEIGEINKVISEKILAGGKGINVSIVLKNLGVTNIALGFIAGFTGNEIKQKIEEFGIETDFVYIQEKNSRINVKIQAKENGRVLTETAVNGEGPNITEEEINKFMVKIEKIKKDDYVVISGSTSKNMNEDIYEKICRKIKERGAEIVIDTTGKYLLNVLKYNPFLVKPNKKELEEIFSTQIVTEKDIIKYAKKLQDNGAQNILISLDREGAILITKDKKILSLKAPKGRLVNSVGSGDSMIAGFIKGFMINGDYETALKFGVAAGSASAFSKDLATKEEILYELSKIEEVTIK